MKIDDIALSFPLVHAAAFLIGIFSSECMVHLKQTSSSVPES